MFCLDGGRLGIGYRNQTIEVIDIHNVKYKVDKKIGYLGAFGRDGLLIVTVDEDAGSITFGPVGEPSRQITQNAESVIAMDVSPDGRLVAVADDSGTVTVYDNNSNSATPFVCKAQAGSKVTNLKLTTADIGKLAILDSTNRIIVWDIKRKRITFEFPLGGPTGGYTPPGYTSPRYPSPLEFSPDRDKIAVAVATDLALLDLDKRRNKYCEGMHWGLRAWRSHLPRTRSHPPAETARSYCGTRKRVTRDSPFTATAPGSPLWRSRPMAKLYSPPVGSTGQSGCGTHPAIALISRPISKSCVRHDLWDRVWTTFGRCRCPRSLRSQDKRRPFAFNSFAFGNSTPGDVDVDSWWHDRGPFLNRLGFAVWP